MNGEKEGIEIAVWLLLVVRIGVLVGIIWFGLSEYRAWKKKYKAQHPELFENEEQE